MAIASLLLGFVSILYISSLIPDYLPDILTIIIAVISIVSSIAGFILGIISLKRANRRKMAISGIVVCCIGLIFSLFGMIQIMAPRAL